MTIICRGALAKMGEAQYGLTPVGTGPFKIVSHELGQGVVEELLVGNFDSTSPGIWYRTHDRLEPITDRTAGRADAVAACRSI